MQKHKLIYIRATIAFASMVAATTVIALPAPAPASASETGESARPENIGYVTHPFTGGVTLDQAQGLSDTSGSSVAGYRIDNGEVVGEYIAAGGQTPSEYRAAFLERYGTEPRVAGFIVKAEPQTLSRKSRGVPESAAPIETGVTDFRPEPVPSEKRAALDAQDGLPSSGASLFSGSNSWRPSNVSSKIKRSGSHQYFDMTVGWYAGTSPAGIDSRFGLEAGVDLYNDATGTRGSILPGDICGPAFRDQFIAKNYDWYSWSVFSPNGSLSASAPYADINDLSDPCGRNSMTIGFKDPQNFPADRNGMYEIATHIDAQVGATTLSRIGGGVQLVDKVNCSWGFSLTDCMGTGLLEGETRFTLGKDRNWVADPNKCWTSGQEGEAAPVSVTCP